MKNILPACLLLATLCTSWGEDKLVVHEWGTFTSLQDEQGNAIGGINTDDEPVPAFVHRIGRLLIPPDQPSPNWSKGTVYCHPDVTMRLETPVIYFHPSAGWKPQPVDVHVAFGGGWLSEFYPSAIFKAPGLNGEKPGEVVSNESADAQLRYGQFGHIDPAKAGELSWKGLILGGEGAGPETAEAVWLSPRNVNAAMVKTSGGESEKFLFYRGIGKVDAPLRIVRSARDGKLRVKDNYAAQNPILNAPDSIRIQAAWLVDVRADGSCAFTAWHVPMVLPAAFDAKEFSAENLARLKSLMRGALINGGLFADETDALLKTWEVSYFKSPGL